MNKPNSTALENDTVILSGTEYRAMLAELAQLRADLKAMTEDRDLWRADHDEDCPNLERVELQSEEIFELRAELTLVRGAMAAQDEREKLAGDRIGISWYESGCDWPDVVADRFLHLRAEIERKDKWISVEEKIPTGEDRLLVCEVPSDPDYTAMCVGYFNRLTGSWFVNGEDMGKGLAITHWLPLPDPPSERDTQEPA